MCACPPSLRNEFRTATAGSLVTRRDFCAAASAPLWVAAITGLSFAITQSERSTPTGSFDVAAYDRARILDAARRYLEESPITITAFTSTRSAGGRHDYFSGGDYWWPDPNHLNGPYVRRDGMSNPNNFTEHRRALLQLGVQVPALAAAWLLTKTCLRSATAE